MDRVLASRCGSLARTRCARRRSARLANHSTERQPDISQSVAFGALRLKCSGLIASRRAAYVKVQRTWPAALPIASALAFGVVRATPLKRRDVRPTRF